MGKFQHSLHCLLQNLTLSTACFKTCDSKTIALLSRRLLRLFHRDQVVMGNRAASHFSKIRNSIMSKKLVQCLMQLCWHFGFSFQSSASFRHLYKVWSTSSGPVLHTSQVPSTITFLWTKFVFNGRTSRHAFQNQIFYFVWDVQFPNSRPKWLHNFRI